MIERALTNVIKHSYASRVLVRVELDQPDRLRIHIEDNGVGFAVAAVHGLSIGISSMKARARLSGTVLVQSEPGRTLLQATLPLNRSWPSHQHLVPLLEYVVPTWFFLQAPK